MKTVFVLSGVPDISDPLYYYGDRIAIQNAITSVAKEVLPRAHLVVSGSPACSLLVRNIASRLDATDNFRPSLEDKPSVVLLIGGTELVRPILDSFREEHPNVPFFPIGSTGGYARFLLDHEEDKVQPPPGMDRERLLTQLRTDLSYDLVFRAVLRPFL
jgi:hypothetical protein